MEDGKMMPAVGLRAQVLHGAEESEEIVRGHWTQNIVENKFENYFLDSIS